MANDLDELKQEVEDLKGLTQDTNKLMHKMHRRARWGMLFQLAWWLTIVGITGAAYYYYVQPYVQKIENIYTSAQEGATRLQGWEGQVQEFLSNYFMRATTTRP